MLIGLGVLSLAAAPAPQPAPHAPREERVPGGGAGRLHQLGQEHAAQLAHACRRAGGGPHVRHPRPHHQVRLSFRDMVGISTIARATASDALVLGMQEAEPAPVPGLVPRDPADGHGGLHPEAAHPPGRRLPCHSRGDLHGRRHCAPRTYSVQHHMPLLHQFKEQGL